MLVIAELEEGDHNQDQEDDHRDGRGIAVIRPASARESDAIGIGDENIGPAHGRRRAGHGWAALVVEIDDSEVVEVEGKGGHQQRPHRDHDQRKGHGPELLPGDWPRRSRPPCRCRVAAPAARR